MKKILYLLLAALTFTACGGSDDPDPTPTPPFDNWNNPANSHYMDGKYNPIKGTWKLTHIGKNAVLPSNVVYFRFNDDFTIKKSPNGNTFFMIKESIGLMIQE